VTVADGFPKAQNGVSLQSDCNDYDKIPTIYGDRRPKLKHFAVFSGK
jgi:hypothetical protein